MTDTVTTDTKPADIADIADTSVVNDTVKGHLDIMHKFILSRKQNMIDIYRHHEDLIDVDADADDANDGCGILTVSLVTKTDTTDPTVDVNYIPFMVLNSNCEYPLPDTIRAKLIANKKTRNMVYINCEYDLYELQI